MKRQIIIIPFMILIYSCTTLKVPISKDEIQKINDSNIKMLNGSYNIYSVDSANRTLEAILFNKKGKYNYANLPDSTVKINLEFIDNKTIKVQLIEKNKVLKTKIKKGEIQDGYFNLKKSIIGSFYLIVNSFGTQTSRICLLKNNNISIDTYDSESVFLVIFPLGGTDCELYNLEFERKN